MNQVEIVFNKNMTAIRAYYPDLYGRLTNAHTHRNCYQFIDGKSGADIPIYIDAAGRTHTLHSLVSPEKEAEKLLAAAGNEGFLIILGLGGAYLASAALKNADVQRVVVIDYNLDGLAELLCRKDYTALFSHPCFTLLQDPDPSMIVQYIIENYLPCIHNGIRVIPLRARCDFDAAHFVPAQNAIKSAIEKAAADFSTQAFFGKRWFSNIVRNIFTAEKQFGIIAPQRNVAICAAGPSLDAQLDHLKQNRGTRYVISTDTATGALLAAGIKPDAIVSIDCQHISYLHFLGNDVSDTTLFLDLASPPLLASRTNKTVFFSGSHPLAAYLSASFKRLPSIDTSGANVSYAAVSLAEKLGAKDIELYGADFSYPQGNAYAKGAFFYPYLDHRQNRFAPSAAQVADFLFKNKSIRRVDSGDSYYYQTSALELYRKKLEEKSEAVSCVIHRVEGSLAPMRLRAEDCARAVEAGRNLIELVSSGKAQTNAKDFLREYKSTIALLPKLEGNAHEYIGNLSYKEGMVFTTLLPAAMAIKRAAPKLSNRELVDELKTYSVHTIEAALDAHA
jgi:hypothetical protein